MVVLSARGSLGEALARHLAGTAVPSSSQIRSGPGILSFRSSAPARPSGLIRVFFLQKWVLPPMGGRPVARLLAVARVLPSARFLPVARVLAAAPRVRSCAARPQPRAPPWASSKPDGRA